MPSYQKDAVEAYLSGGTALPPSTMYNGSNRGFPDIAAMGNGFAVYVNTYGGWTTVGGTSASSPTVAASIGYLNPLLYKMYAASPDAFTDVTIGDNKCTEDGCASTCKGYECAKGWDPVTGLGTPVVDKMVSYVESLIASKSSVAV